MGLFKTDVLKKKQQALAVFDSVKTDLQEFLSEAKEEVSQKQDNIRSLEQEIQEEQTNIDVLDEEMAHANKVIANIENITS